MNVPKIVVLQTHPIQYYAPIYKLLAERGRVALTVVYLSDAGAIAHRDPGFDRDVAWDVPLLDGYNFRILQPNSGIVKRSFWRAHDTNLYGILANERPEWILLYGYATRMNWSALRWAKRNGVRVAYTSDTNIRLVKRDWRLPAKHVVVRFFFNRVDAFLSPSDANREYLILFGARQDRIRWSPFAVDLDRFTVPLEPRAHGDVDFLWAGKMLDIKRPLDFVNALSRVIGRGCANVRGTMIGTGPMLDEVKRIAATVLPSGVLDLPGFVNQSAMPNALSRGATFVFTSERDQYGLAVAEAAACGRALIVADINGCVGPNEVARPGINALSYAAGDVGALADAMTRLMTDPTLLGQMQRASARIALRYGVSEAAKAIEEMAGGERA